MRLSRFAVPMIMAMAAAACDSPAQDAGHVHSATGASAQPLRTGEQFVHLRMREAYTPGPPGSGSDDYRCMVINP